MAPNPPAKPAAAPATTDKSGAKEAPKPDAAVQSTTKTTDADKGAGGTVATQGNFSPKQVDGVTTIKKDDGNVGAVNQGTAAAASSGAPSPDPNANIGLTAEQQAAIDAQKNKDNNPDPTEAELDELDRKENGGKTLAELKEEEDRQKAILNADDPGEVAAAANKKLRDEEVRRQRHSMLKLAKLAALFNDTTPDSHSIYGYGGISISLGDIRNVAKAIERGTGINKDTVIE